ncbi:MAG: hypothetical protein RLZZ57_1415 [Pseudomonadota bacterium]|jgi:integrase
MPSQALTGEFIASLKHRAPDKGLVSFFDTDIRGFVLELRATGGGTYYFRYRDRARKLRLQRLGRLDEIPLSDARAKAYALRQMVRDGADPKAEAYRLRDVPSFGDFIRDRYLPHAKTRKRSWRCDDSIIRVHLLPFFADYRLTRISRADVIKRHNAIRENGYSASTANLALILLRFIFNCAIRWEILPQGANPTQGVPLFENNNQRQRYLNEAELQRLLLELDRNHNRQVCNAIKLLLLTGARKHEILEARWEYVDFTNRILTVPVSKSGKPRHVSLSDAAIELLQSLPRPEGVDWVFHKTGTNKPRKSIATAWDAIRKEADIPDVRVHDLRHSFASFLVNQGRSLYEVQRLLGHTNSKTTMRYAHLSQKALVDAANVVGRVVSNSTPLPKQAAPKLRKPLMPADDALNQRLHRLFSADQPV